MNWLLFALAIFNLTAVASLYYPRPIHRSTGFMLTVYAFSLLTSELAWVWMVLQGILAVLLILGGALDSGFGWLGLLILLATWLVLFRCHKESLRTGDLVEDALCQGLGRDYREAIPAEVQADFSSGVKFADWRNPVAFNHPDVELISVIPYLPGGVRQFLDIYRPRVIPEEGCPVLLQIHGGGWMYSHKRVQALPLMYHMASKGWIVVSANYRLSPSVGFPAHLEDCKAALCWIREQGREYGMNPDFVAVTGGSAGGHLTSLMGLTANRPELQKSHPDTDTSVQACIPFYGQYDFLGAVKDHPDSENVHKFLVNNIMHVGKEDDPDLWQLASPVTQVREDAPPFMILHGALDTVLFVDDARVFVKKLTETSDSPVVYAELPGADHGFDLFVTPRALSAVDGVHRFLEWARAQAN